jgi:hypothetical protein
MSLVGQLIYYNKLLLDYIFEFDGTYKENFKKEFILNRKILEASHYYWYNRYEKALFLEDSDIIILQLQDAFFDTLNLWDPTILG